MSASTDYWRGAAARAARAEFRHADNHLRAWRFYSAACAAADVYARMIADVVAVGGAPDDADVSGYVWWTSRARRWSSLAAAAVATS